MYNSQQVGFDSSVNWAQPQVQQPTQSTGYQRPAEESEENDASHRPPNAFILYSQKMRNEVRQKNPNLSNTEVSRILGKMWKEVPNDVKFQYKQQAASLQEAFKRDHPNYTYRKARRKRALNELLTRSTGIGAFDPQMQMNMLYSSVGFPQGMGQMPTMQQGMGQIPQPSSMNQQPMFSNYYQMGTGTVPSENK